MPQGSKFSLTQTPRIGLVIPEALWDPSRTLASVNCDQETDRRTEDSNSYIPAQLQNGCVWVNIVCVCVANACHVCVSNTHYKNALFIDQQVRKNVNITLKMGPTDTIHCLKIILLQYFQYPYWLIACIWHDEICQLIFATIHGHYCTFWYYL